MAKQAAISTGERKYVMILRSVGNPDFGQYAPISEPKAVKGSSLKAMVQAAEEYIAENDLGGGNFVEPEVRLNGKPVAYISYNGRVWKSRPGSNTSGDGKSEEITVLS